MALDPNIGRIKFLRSKTAGLTPTTADIDEGELALNLVDRTIYTRNGNNIIDMGFGKGGQVNGNIAASGTVKATKLEGPLTGNADSATKLQNTRTLSWTGDATGSLTFDGTANRSAVLTLANSGVTAGTYKSVTVDAKGRVTAGSDVITGLVTSTAASGTTNTATSNTNTYLNIVETVGSAATTVGTSTQVTGAGTVTVTSDTAGKLTITGSQNITGSATSITVQGNTTALEGTQLPPDGFRVVRAYNNGYPAPYGNVLQVGGTGQNEVLLGWPGADGGVADTFIRNKRDTASAPWSNWRKVVFEDALNSLTVDKANSLVTARTINGVAFNGTANITIADNTKLPLSGGSIQGNLIVSDWFSTPSVRATSGYDVIESRTIKPNQIAKSKFNMYFVGKNGLNSPNSGTDYGDLFTINGWNDSSGGAKNSLFFAKTSKRISHYQAAYDDDVWGAPSELAYLTDNVASATKLQTTRTIGISGSSGARGSVSFDGTGNALIPLSVITQPTATNNLTIATTAFVQAVNSADTGSAATALALKTARTINGTSFDGTSNITIADNTKLPLTGGTISGNLQIHNGLIVRNDVLVEGGIQGKTVRNRTGLDEKMYWIGAWNRPDQTNVVVTPVDANTLSFRINIQSGSMYIVNGVSQIHMLTGWGDGANAKFINPVIMSTTDVNAGKQVIDVIANQPNHGITAPTNYFWHALTYESYGCKIDKWGGHIGDTRFLVRLKCDEKFVMQAPLVSATSTSNNWFSGTQSGLGYPLQHSSYAVIVPTSIVEEQVVIWNVVENNTDAPANNCPYVSIVVKDRIA